MPYIILKWYNHFCSYKLMLLLIFLHKTFLELGISFQLMRSHAHGLWWRNWSQKVEWFAQGMPASRRTRGRSQVWFPRLSLCYKRDCSYVNPVKGRLFEERVILSFCWRDGVWIDSQENEGVCRPFSDRAEGAGRSGFVMVGSLSYWGHTVTCGTQRAWGDLTCQNRRAMGRFTGDVPNELK